MSGLGGEEEGGTLGGNPVRARGRPAARERAREREGGKKRCRGEAGREEKPAGRERRPGSRSGGREAGGLAGPRIAGAPRRWSGGHLSVCECVCVGSVLPPP